MSCSTGNCRKPSKPLPTLSESLKSCPYELELRNGVFCRVQPKNKDYIDHKNYNQEKTDLYKYAENALASLNLNKN